MTHQNSRVEDEARPKGLRRGEIGGLADRFRRSPIALRLIDKVGDNPFLVSAEGRS